MGRTHPRRRGPASPSVPQLQCECGREEMLDDVSLSPNQERFVQALVAGQTIVAAARAAGVTEQTGHRWLKNPLVRAEQKRLQAALRDAEQAAIEQIATVHYASMENRVRALDALARKLEGYLQDEDKVWLPDVKSIGLGKDAERVDLVQFNDALVREYRATFDDLAKELGQRVRRNEVEHSGLVEVLASEHASLLSDLEALPDAGQKPIIDTITPADSD